MEEKQAVIKELPIAPWHSKLWSNIITTKNNSINEYNKELKILEREDMRNKEIHNEALEKIRNERKEIRRQELIEYHKNKNSTNKKLITNK